MAMIFDLIRRGFDRLARFTAGLFSPVAPLPVYIRTDENPWDGSTDGGDR